MKHTRRSIAYFLLVCILLTFLPLSAFAEETSAGTSITFDFTGVVAEGSLVPEQYNNTDLGRNWRLGARSRGDVTCYPEYTEYALKPIDPSWDMTQKIMDYEWFNLYTLYGIDSGSYTMDIQLDVPQSARSIEAAIYIQPVSDRAYINHSGTQNYMLKNEPVGTFNLSSGTNTIKNLVFAGDPDGSYYITIRILHNAGAVSLDNTYMRLKSIVLTKSQKAPAPTTQPTIPNFNEPEAPADDAGSFPVIPVVIGAAALAVIAVVIVVVSKKKKSSAE